MLYVLHNKNFLNYILTNKLSPSRLDCVATVDTTDLEEAFRLTNHIDSDWQGNPKVNAIAGIHRSTSVGDVIVDGTPGGLSSKHYIVESLGFRLLTPEEITMMTFTLPDLLPRSKQP